jgi:hypothetical protein
MYSEEEIKSITAKHDQAMNLCEEAFFENRKKNSEKAKELFLTAYKLERECAEMIEEGMEPTRSVLYSSAMHCANDAGLKKEAFELAEKLLSFTKYEEYIEDSTKIIGEFKAKS